MALLPKLRAFARFLARDAVLADDLVQDTVLRALRSGRPDDLTTDLRLWTFAILRNRFRDQRRRAAVERVALERQMPTEQGRAGNQEASAALNDLDTALSRLPTVQREALTLVAALGFSVEEAASIAGVPAGTIKARISRARLRLAREPAAPAWQGK
ncbi:sigma-70 family RNA polymerase sigma factor [Humitalea rosea]|uniref:sigma-70 family RNA polymerase sigma factor n=1 Tax=Humitalea rosea TaxID=990373 RepID=UPI001FEB6B52|nr:sigma-70 family RNA polymerase sigma factor [Humitalea rosea]